MSYLSMTQAITLARHNDIKRATSPFCQYFHISQLWYNQINDRGFLAGFSNHPSWTEYFAAENLYQKCPMLRHSSCLKEGITMFNNSSVDDVDRFLNEQIVSSFYQTRTLYDLHVWIVVIVKTKNGSEQFGCFIPKAAIPLFFNELQLVRSYFSKFRECLGKTLQTRLENYQVNLQDVFGRRFYEKTLPILNASQDKKILLQQLGYEVSLKPKEQDVLRLVLQGYSAKAIAPQVFLAKRTIDHMLERIKGKFNCSSKTELIQKAREIENLGGL